jgi:hypothetical protein
MTGEAPNALPRLVAQRKANSACGPPRTGTTIRRECRPSSASVPATKDDEALVASALRDCRVGALQADARGGGERRIKGPWVIEVRLDE